MTESASSLERHPRPSVAVDVALMTVMDGALRVLLMRREDGAAVGGDWALPGGFVYIDDPLERTVERVLREKAGRAEAYVEQLATFGAVDRDPRGRVLSVAYLGLVPAGALSVEGQGDLVLAELRVDWPGEAGGPASAWHDGRELELAFDHGAMLGEVVRRLRGKLDYSAIALALLPETFTLRDVQEVHEAILGRALNKPAFRRKLLDRGLVAPTGRRETASAFRPAELYIRAEPAQDEEA